MFVIFEIMAVIVGFVIIVRSADYLGCFCMLPKCFLFLFLNEKLVSSAHLRDDLLGVIIVFSLWEAVMTVFRHDACMASWRGLGRGHILNWLFLWSFLPPLRD